MILLGCGVCRFYFKKSGNDFARYVIFDVMKENMFSAVNPYFDKAEIFNNEGEEIICGERDLESVLGGIGENFLITVWKEKFSVSVMIDISDKEYDFFDLCLDGLSIGECNMLIKCMADFLKGEPNLCGILIDKNEVLTEFCYMHEDYLCTDFMFNSQSAVKKEFIKACGYDSHIENELEIYSLEDKRLNEIYIYSFLSDKKIGVEIFRIK